MNWQNIITTENIDKHYDKYVKIILVPGWVAGPTFVDTVYEELQHIRDYNSGIFKLVKMNVDADEWDLDEIWIEPDDYDLGNIYARLNSFHPSYLGGQDNEADLQYYFRNPAAVSADRDDIPYYVEIPKDLERLFKYDDIGYYLELYDPLQKKIKTKQNILDRTQRRKQNKLDKESFKEFTKGISVSKDPNLSKLRDKNIQYHILEQMNAEPKYWDVLKSEIDKQAFNEFTKGISVSKDNDLSKLKDKDIQKNILKQLSKYQGGNLTQGGKLIGEGSKTCIFKPNIPCLNKDVNISENNISKVFLTEKNNKYFKEEINFNKKIYKLENSKHWSVTLFNQCKLDNYEKIKKIEKDIDKCLKNQQISIEEFNRNKYMLYGLYGGISMDDSIKNLNLNEKNIFNFLKKTHSLFYGLTIMKKNKILHYDIKSANIVLNNNSLKYIDYGISTTFDNMKKIKKRALKEYNSNRIYIFYPFEIFYIFLNEKQIRTDLNKKIYKKRKNYDNLYNIHKLFFNRDLETELLENILQIKKNKLKSKEIIEKLDLYSLGITITLIFMQQIFKITDNDNDFKSFINHKTMKPIINFLKSITEISSLNRITPEQALNKLEEIINYKPQY